MGLSVVGANFMSCHHAEAKIHYLSCSYTNREFPARKQSPTVVGTVKPTNIPIEKPQEVIILFFDYEQQINSFLWMLFN